EDHFMLTWVDDSNQSQQRRIVSSRSETCEYWTWPEVVPGAFSRVPPALAFDWHRNRFVLVWSDADDGKLRAATRHPSNGTWSSVEQLGYMPAALGPAISYSYGNVGALSF